MTDEMLEHMAATIVRSVGRTGADS
jgi:hypothetical protein